MKCQNGSGLLWQLSLVTWQLNTSLFTCCPTHTSVFITDEIQLCEKPASVEAPVFIVLIYEQYRDRWMPVLDSRPAALGLFGNCYLKGINELFLFSF